MVIYSGAFIDFKMFKTYWISDFQVLWHDRNILNLKSISLLNFLKWQSKQLNDYKNTSTCVLLNKRWETKWVKTKIWIQWNQISGPQEKKCEKPKLNHISQEVLAEYWLKQFKHVPSKMVSLNRMHLRLPQWSNNLHVYLGLNHDQRLNRHPDWHHGCH